MPRKQKKTCILYGDVAISKNTVLKCFVRFRKGHFELENRERLGKPEILDDDQLENLIKNILGQTTRCITETLHVSHIRAW